MPTDKHAAATKSTVAAAAAPAAASSPPAVLEVELSGRRLFSVRLANFLVCKNGVAHMFECPLTWWRPPRNFDLEHSMQ